MKTFFYCLLTLLAIHSASYAQDYGTDVGTGGKGGNGYDAGQLVSKILSPDYLNSSFDCFDLEMMSTQALGFVCSEIDTRKSRLKNSIQHELFFLGCCSYRK